MALLTAMKTMLDDIRTMPASTDIREHLEASVGRIVTMSQTIVREEWLRMKRGA
jgi:hypothetical protein